MFDRAYLRICPAQACFNRAPLQLLHLDQAGTAHGQKKAPEPFLRGLYVGTEACSHGLQNRRQLGVTVTSFPDQTAYLVKSNAIIGILEVT